jgi:N-acetylmuramoyl-L-alanine amidase
MCQHSVMALYRLGDSGDSVRDIQHRLDVLGFESDDEPGDFGAATERAVKSFQEHRRLPVDGIVGPETWRTMVDAGFGLGDRQLYLRMPMFHGDDVAELQRSLNALGFDAGDVDGIFGPDTLRALIDFQHNRRLPEDGIAGPGVLAELALMRRETSKVGRHEIREKVWLSSLPDSLVGLRVFLDPFCRTEEEAAAAWQAAVSAYTTLRHIGAHPIASRSSDTRPSERLRALSANERGADLVIGFAHPGQDDEGVYSFASRISHSAAGAALAMAVARVLEVPTHGRIMPILVETRPPAIVVARGDLTADIGETTILAVEQWLERLGRERET